MFLLLQRVFFFNRFCFCVCFYFNAIHVFGVLLLLLLWRPNFPYKLPALPQASSVVAPTARLCFYFDRSPNINWEFRLLNQAVRCSYFSFLVIWIFPNSLRAGGAPDEWTPAKTKRKDTYAAAEIWIHSYNHTKCVQWLGCVFSSCLFVMWVFCFGLIFSAPATLSTKPHIHHIIINFHVHLYVILSLCCQFALQTWLHTYITIFIHTTHSHIYRSRLLQSTAYLYICIICFLGMCECAPT